VSYIQKVIVVLVATGIIILLVTYVIRRYRNRIKPLYFRQKWLELQRYCADRKTWPLAVTSADLLLEEALKKRRMKGKSLGEKLAHAQHYLSNNDSVWFAHNLSKKLHEKANSKLREADVKRALVGIRQALKDLGALRDDK
jgi:hypothetical protein